MTTDHFRYDVLTQEALRSVVHKVLLDVAKNGLPGEHHFFISFRTDHPDVRMSQRLREKHPGEMTIVLQYQFWDLGVSDVGMEVGLSFNGIAEKLVIPYEAMTGFFDPSVQFGLRFETVDEAGNENDEMDTGSIDQDVAPIPTPRKKKPRGAASEPEVVKTGEKSGEDGPDDTSPAGGAEVVSLDKFRKKKD